MLTGLTLSPPPRRLMRRPPRLLEVYLAARSLTHTRCSPYLPFVTPRPAYTGRGNFRLLLLFVVTVAGALRRVLIERYAGKRPRLRA